MTARKSEFKPISFTTTLRNPERMKEFLKILSVYEGQKLTNILIMKVVRNLIKSNLYTPIYVNRNFKNKFLNQEPLSDIEVSKIIEESPQKHKEAGFDQGWPSRFDTWYKFAMELGFVYYEMNKPIEFSETGHRLINTSEDSDLEQYIFTNAFIKYQTKNPFRKVLNNNVPLVLLLQVLEKFKTNSDNPGISRLEIPLFLCWRDNNFERLYEAIKDIRSKFSFNVSEEYIYEMCLGLLGAKKEDEKRFKMSKILKESTDEFIRKMKYTGLITIRGFGRFIDINSHENARIDYILKKYTSLYVTESKYDYFTYMGHIDNNIISIESDYTFQSKDTSDSLQKWLTHYTFDDLSRELSILVNNRNSKDEVLKFINSPLRLEFLTSIVLKKQFPNLNVKPNYKIDDEGLPSSHAGGGVADIECFDEDFKSLFEVTLIKGTVQVARELVPITRHLKEAKQGNINAFTVFLSPKTHPDTIQYVSFVKYKDKVDIIPVEIDNLVNDISNMRSCNEFLKLKIS